MNALGIRHIKNNVRILLINNGGGAEFKIMTKDWKQKVAVENFISANGHNGNAKGWSENCGFKYLSASNKEEFQVVKNEFVSFSDKPVILEVFTNEDDEPVAMQTLISANREVTISGQLKNVVTNIVGEKGIKVIKKILR